MNTPTPLSASPSSLPRRALLGGCEAADWEVILPLLDAGKMRRFRPPWLRLPQEPEEGTGLSPLLKYFPKETILPIAGVRWWDQKTKIQNTKIIKSKFILALAAGIIGLAASANAAVTVATSGTGAAGNITITLPTINFTATSNFAGGTLAIVFDEAQPNAGNDRGVFNFNGPNLAGGAINFYADSGFTGGPFTQNDPYIVTFGATPFSSGDTVSFAGGTISMTSAQSNLDVFASGSYEVFLVDGNNGSRISPNGVASAGGGGTSAVPEASTSLGLLALGAGGILTRRRLKRKA